MKLKIAAGAVGALILAVFGAMYYIAGTPHYSLYLVRNSIRNDDPATFFAHFDQDRVIHHAIERSVGGVPSGPDVVSKNALDVAVPTGKRVLENRILERLQDPSTIPLLYTTIESVRYEGNAATITLRSTGDGSTTNLIMARMPNRHWKIVDLDLSKANVDFALKDMM